MLIVCLGGSITEGLGVTRSGKTYANLLEMKLKSSYYQPVEVINYGGSAMQVNESRRRYENKILELQPDIIVFAHGNTEAVVREQKKYLRILPKRWRRPGWMDPRPYYSTRRSRRYLESIESGLRWRVKVTLIKVLGGKQWMTLEEFKWQTTDFITTIFKHSTKTKIILLTPGDIEEKYFPGSPESMRKYRGVLKEVHEQYKASNRLFMCDSSSYLHQWDDYFADRFHPNEHGHNKIAKALEDVIIDNDLISHERDLEEVNR